MAHSCGSHVERITVLGVTFLWCGECGTEWDYQKADPTDKERAHAKMMIMVDEHTTHTCDGPVTPFVHLVRTLELIEQGKLSAEDAANYLSERNLLKEENYPIPSCEF